MTINKNSLYGSCASVSVIGSADEANHKKGHRSRCEERSTVVRLRTSCIECRYKTDPTQPDPKFGRRLGFELAYCEHLADSQWSSMQRPILVREKMARRRGQAVRPSSVCRWIGQPYVPRADRSVLLVRPPSRLDERDQVFSMDICLRLADFR
jgi:hypothetical protein